MGKTFKDTDDDSRRDRKRNRAGWKAERKAARDTKAAGRGEFVGKRALHRAAKFSN